MAQKVTIDTATKIGATFVLRYYTLMHTAPHTLMYFYKEESVFSHGIEDGNQETCIGQKKINDKIESLGFKDCQVAISNIECQPSLNDGILVVVLGSLSNRGEPSRRFVQTFYLAVQIHPQGYYVLNDVFRYLKDSGKEDSPFPVPPQSIPTPKVEQSVQVVEAPVPKAAPTSKGEVQVVPSVSKEEDSTKVTPSSPSVQSSHTSNVVPHTKTQSAKSNQQRNQGKQQRFKAKNTEKTEPVSQTESVPVPTTTTTTPPTSTTTTTVVAPTTVPSVTPTEKREEEQPITAQVQQSPQVQASPQPVQKPSQPPSSWAALFTPTSAQEESKPSEIEQPSEVKETKEIKETKESKEDTKVLYIHSLPSSVTEEKLSTVFSSFGQIVKVKVFAGKGFGFIEFDSVETSQNVLQQTKVNPITMDGKTIVVEEKKQKQNKTDSNRNFQNRDRNQKFNDRRNYNNGKDYSNGNNYHGNGNNFSNGNFKEKEKQSNFDKPKYQKNQTKDNNTTTDNKSFKTNNLQKQQKPNKQTTKE